MFTKSIAAYLLGPKYKYIGTLDYCGHRNMTNERCTLYEFVETLSLSCSVSKIKAFIRKISTENYVPFFIIPSQPPCQPLACGNGCLVQTSCPGKREGKEMLCPVFRWL